MSDISRAPDQDEGQEGGAPAPVAIPTISLATFRGVMDMLADQKAQVWACVMVGRLGPLY